MPNPGSRACLLLARPLQWLPPRLHSGGLALALNHLLAHALAAGELEFLAGRVVAIDVDDLGFGFRLACDGQGFRRAPAGSVVDVSFRGGAHAFLQLATQQEDADTLFFQRLIRIEGDTATGLHLKNFLDALGESPLPTPAREALLRFTAVYERRCLGMSSTGDAGCQSSPGRPNQ